MANYWSNVWAALTGRTYSIKSASDVEELLRFGGTNTSMSGRSINEEAAMRVGTANRSINLLSGIISSMPMHILKTDGDNSNSIDHPLKNVLTIRPNANQTPKQFKAMQQAWLLLRGNAYAQIIRDSRGDCISLIPLLPTKMRTELRDDGTKEHIYNDKGREIVFRDDEILHMMGLSLDGVKGLSVISYMRESLSIAIDSEEASSVLMKNGSFLDGVLTHPNKLSPEAYKRLKESWAEKRSGVSNAGGTAILEEGAKLEKLSMSAADLQFLEQRNFQRYDIAMFYGVPPHMLGLTDKTTSWGSGIEQMNIGFVQYTLNDWITIWEESLKRSCLKPSEKENHEVFMDPQFLLKGDLKSQWDSFAKAREIGVYSPNDIRRKLGENPRTDPGGDEYQKPPNESGNDKEGEEPDDENEPVQPAE